MADTSLGILLFVAHRDLERRVSDEVRAAGFEVTMAQARIFQRIDEEGSRVTKLAESAGVTKQTAGYLVDQLAQAGYVERVPDPVDARARLVRVTALGRTAVEVARPVEEQVYAEWAEHLGGEDLERLREILARLREITDPYA